MTRPDWQGSLQRTDSVTGKLICSMTGWKLALTGTSGGRGCVHLSGRFDGEVMGDDAPSWTEEATLAAPHQCREAGYDCRWVGTIRSDDGKTWAGELADFYGGRLTLAGTTTAPGVIALRATTDAYVDA